MLTGLLVPVAFRNKCERATGPKPEPFQSIFPGVNATRTSGTGLERNANRNRCEQGLRYWVGFCDVLSLPLKTAHGTIGNCRLHLH